MEEAVVTLLSIATGGVLALAGYWIGRNHADRDSYAAHDLAFAIDFFLEGDGHDDFSFLELISAGNVEALRRDWPEWFAYRDRRFLMLEGD